MSHGIIPKKVGDTEYVIEPDSQNKMNVPVRIFADKDLLSKMLTDRTIMQATNVATMPGTVGHVAVLPDGHEGYGFPVGGVAAMDAKEGMISPGGVGYDINCGVRLLRTDLDEEQIRPRLRELVTDLFTTIPSGVGSKGAVRLNSSELDEVLSKGVEWAVDSGYGQKGDIDVCEENGHMKNADPHMVSDRARKRGAPQLGSLGSGNHFLEIQKVDEIHDPKAAALMGITRVGQITVLTHCGSRGLGHQVCSDYLRVSEQSLGRYGINLADRELACVPNGSKEGESYKSAMFSALNFAWGNRQMISHWTRKSFERVMRMSENDLGMDLVYDVSHNIAKIEEHRIDGKRRRVVVHRKGATRAFPSGMDEIPLKYRNVGQPVFIPGSMGTASWILVGKPNSMDLTFGSTAHGAGRTMSRSKARRQYTEEGVKKSLNSSGIFVKSLTREGVVEEAPGAYKDVDHIAKVSHKMGIATKVARLVPIGVIKG
ncbi:MAG: tRNA-splicing ligase RtcB [Cenarchaeum symbiont of Oopsacas minuta]|nr:tRNA-splicing ligase RtcB [Cenarchaeum symbiont of Oopsacas minuta]